MKTIYTLLSTILLLSSFLLNAQFEKVKDFGFDEGYAEFKIKFNNKIYFDVDRQLWETDGTTSGTKEIEGVEWGYRFIHQKDSIAYFFHNGELKKLNGNTSQIQTLPGGLYLGEGGKIFQGSYIYGSPRNILTQEYILQSYNFTSGIHDTIITFSVDEPIVSINVLEDKICFQVGIDIWISDGTNAGTEMIFQGSDYEIKSIKFGEVAITNGSLIFSAESDIYGIEPWRTDGTIGGTFLIKDLALGVNANTGKPNNSYPDFMIANNDLVYFVSYQADLGGYVLYETDGTEQGTQIKKLLSQDLGFSRVNEVDLFQDRLIFLALTEKFGTEFWISDEAVMEINLLKDIWKGGGDFRDYPTRFEKSTSDNYIYFPADDGIYGKELWRTDGTTEGTVMIKDLTPRAGWSNPWVMSNIEEDFFFYAGNALDGYSLYKVNDNAPISIPLPYPIDYDWFTSMGKLQNYSGGSKSNKNDDVIVDRQNNIYLAGDYNSFNMTFFDDTTLIEGNLNGEGYQRDFLVSFDDNGKFRWGKNIGGESHSKKKVITLDQEDNLFVAGRIYNQGGFDSLQITSNNGNLYITKYDTEGNLIWLKQARIGNKGEPNQITTDDEGNIYVAGCFNGFSASFGNFDISANSNFGFFLVKYDKNGNGVWAKNLEFPYKEGDLHGAVNSLLIEGNNIYTILSQGAYNWSSSCKYSDHVIRINCQGLDGEQKWQKDFISDDLTYVTKAAINPTGGIFMIGRYRGDFYLHDYLLSTNCEQSGSFLVKLSNSGKVIKVKSFLPDEVFLYDIEFDKHENYYLSGREIRKEENYPSSYNLSPFQNYSNKTFVKKYDKFDGLLEERHFRKYHQYWHNSNPQIAINYNDEILLSDSYSFSFDTISNVQRNTNQQVLLMKFSLENSNSYEKNQFLETSNIIISPNPARNSISIFSPDEDFVNAKISLFDSSGKYVGIEKQSFDFGYKVLDISGLSSGVYIVVIELGDQMISKKIIKH